ncbi:hypothetical protein [Comamonas suwonensis]|uniref:hypothetical protein n=1 Tax=Comamonas suwonensis TaxID=2606214 RepID=UPI00145C5973|nr:hypothetical protein [Comamonas suwonensis]MBI1623866.1 hypothetical protein [Comamonas suwonensis]
MDNTTILSGAAIFISACSFSVSFLQMKISSAKTKLDLYNKRFSIYLAALEYFQATWHEPHDKAQEESRRFTKAYRESQFLFEKNSGIYEILGKIQQNGAKILFHKKYKYESENNLTKDRLDLSSLHESSMKAQFEFEENLKLLENQIGKYISFRSIEGWHIFK